MKKIRITEEQYTRIFLNETTENRLNVNSLRASHKFWDLLKFHEGNPKQKGEPMTYAYKDSVGVWTIGYGHTGDYAKPKSEISKEQANKLFIKDVNESADCVKRFLKEWEKQGVKGKDLKQNEYEALISLVFNSGCQAVRTSDFIQKLKYGKYDEASEMIKNYRSEGLANRRKSEYELFKNGNYMKI